MDMEGGDTDETLSILQMNPLMAASSLSARSACVVAPERGVK